MEGPLGARSQMKAFVSIHDVMPHTLERVARIIHWLEHRKVPPVTLLVVPGRPWDSTMLAQLRLWVDSGHSLAAHGWHHATSPRRFYHKLHATLISRNVAEHLDLDSPGILELMKRSKAWFNENDLPSPDFYVPPAWALGSIGQDDLRQVPFRCIETTRGIIRLVDGDIELQKRPLTGYEADTAFREYFLRNWNAFQAKQARRKKITLRISIHPDDLELRVADQMDSQIQQVDSFVGPEEV